MSIEKTIYDLKLHEIIVVEGVESSFLFTIVMRVEGGFIYRSYDKSHDIFCCVFVPFNW